MKLHSDRYKTGEKALSREEYGKLLAVITDLQDELMIRLGVASGLRREDLCNIEFENIDLFEGTIFFYEAKKRQNRMIYIQDDIVALIKKYVNTLSKEDRKRPYLFDYVGRTAYRHFNFWCREAGIPERPIHALRATCIKFAHDAGWSDEQISKLTGDKISTIHEHYMTPSQGEMKEITRKGFV
jgi:integrase